MIRFATLAINVLEGVQSSLWLRDQIKSSKKRHDINIQSWYGGPSFWSENRELENRKPTGYIEVEIVRPK